jgi:hypothetical protein
VLINMKITLFFYVILCHQIQRNLSPPTSGQKNSQRKTKVHICDKWKESGDTRRRMTNGISKTGNNNHWGGGGQVLANVCHWPEADLLYFSLLPDQQTRYSSRQTLLPWR